MSELFAYLNKHPIQLMVASTFREPVPNSSHKMTWCECNTPQTGCFLHPTHFIPLCLAIHTNIKKHFRVHEQSMNHFFLNTERQACMTVTAYVASSLDEQTLEAIFSFLPTGYTSCDMYIQKINCLYYTT